jgi:hypothetical protein
MRKFLLHAEYVFYGSDYMIFNVPLLAVEVTEQQIRYEDGLKW